MMRNRKVWGVLGLLLALVVVVGYGQQQPVGPPPPLPKDFIDRINAGRCPCYPLPAPDHRCIEVPGVFPAKAGTYRLWWYEDPGTPIDGRDGVSRKHSLAWYHDPSAWAFTLKEVGAAPGDPKGHHHTGMLSFILPAWALQGGKGVLAFVMHDRRFGTQAVYYSDRPISTPPPRGAKVWTLPGEFEPEVYLICWEDWRDSDFNDQIDVLQIP